MTNQDHASLREQDARSVPGELVARLEERRSVLLATADLFDVIGTFMEGVAKGTWAEYEAAPETEAAESPLRQKHREAMRVRDDYKSAARENRNDVTLFDDLLKATTALKTGSVGMKSQGDVMHQETRQTGEG